MNLGDFMNKEAIKNKMIYFAALASMCLALIFVMYNFFYRTIEIDMMKNVKLEYSGENGIASVVAKNASEDINQRTQDFLDDVKYEVNPNKNLSNGDIIHVMASYNAELASQYHYKPINTEMDFIVEGLFNRYKTVSDIPSEYLNLIYKESEKYIKAHSQQIYNLDTISQEDTKVEFKESKILYSAFLKSKTNQSSDRIISICQLDYMINNQISTIYYLVCVPGINDGNKVQTPNVYGEQAYLSETEKEEKSFKEYVKRVFKDQYTIETVELMKEVVENE